MITIKGKGLSCLDIHHVAHGAYCTIDPDTLTKMEENSFHNPSAVLETKRAWLLGGEKSQSSDLKREFILGHCAGVGSLFPPIYVRAAMISRINVLASGHTGSRPIAAQKILELLNRNHIPKVPSQGSVGAAGDLAPMAHIARIVCGYGPPLEGFTPLSPTAKECLSLINGVSLSAALGAIAIVRAQRVLDAAVIAAAMTMEAIYAQDQCLNEKALSLRGHPECMRIGADLRTLLAGSQRVHSDRRPDAFSIRCGPSVMGSTLLAVEHTRKILEQELNGCSDNPLLIDGSWIEAGHFHGTQIALALDHLKIALTQLATLSERRTFRLTHEKLSKDLPSFLVEGTGLNSGFMLAQYTAAALASECKGLAMPASVDTIPTVQHHEDHVSMAPISARHALDLLECLADIIAIELLLAAQALDLRKQSDGLPLPKPIAEIHDMIRSKVLFWSDDQVLHPDLKALGELVRHGIKGSSSPW
jgi:histidine ammonia-lyase